MYGFMYVFIGCKWICVEGEIIIGNNVYVGFCCVFNLGVKVGDSIFIGSNVVVVKFFYEFGMYVF